MTSNFGFCILLLGLSNCAKPNPATQIFRVGWLWDGQTTQPKAHQQLVVRDGIIISITNDDHVPADPNNVIIDLRNSLVMPGHAHLKPAPMSLDPSTTLEYLRSFKQNIRQGVTTAAMLYGSTKSAILWREFVGTAQHRGPRLFVGTTALPLCSGASDNTSFPTLIRDLAETGAEYLLVEDDASFPLGQHVCCVAVAAAVEHELPVLFITSTWGVPPCAFQGHLEASTMSSPQKDPQLVLRLLGLDDALGRLAVGYRADFIARAYSNNDEVFPPWQTHSTRDQNIRAFIDGVEQLPKDGFLWLELLRFYTYALWHHLKAMG